MARRDPVHEAAQRYSNSNTSSASNTNSANNTNCVDCSGSGNFWVIPESYQIIKYVTPFGKTKYKGPALTGKAMLPFGKFIWRKHIEIIDIRNRISNLTPINDFKSSDGLTVCADPYVQYTVTNVHKYVLNQIDFNEKLQENIKSILQQFFRNLSSKQILKNEVSIESVGEDKFQALEEQYGISITNFSAIPRIPEIEDDKTKRKEMQIQMQTQKAQLKLQKELLKIQREIQKYSAETDSLVRKEHLESIISSIISKFPKQDQAALISKIYEIDKLANSNANITYISGAENFNQNSNSRSK